MVNEWNDGLRCFLLPVVNQGMHRLNSSARQLAKEVLDDPVDVMIQPGIIQRPGRDSSTDAVAMHFSGSL